MFGRRRRPILGAAVVVGASRAAAKREVRKQDLIATERDLEIQRGIELQRRQEDEQERRTQRAVEEAMRKAALEEQAVQRSTVTNFSPPQPRYDETYPVMQVQTRDLGLFNPVDDANAIIQPAPAYQLGAQFSEGKPQRAAIPGPEPSSK
ncbi:hypothetical protein ACLX1H_003099 [Fusarium chlamydosporum]